MYPSTLAITAKTGLIHEITRQLHSLSSLQLPDESLQAVRLIQIRRLARRIETLVPDHFGHGERTACYALLLAETIGLTEKERGDLHYAALLHDIGLLTLPGKLLDEASPPTLDDYVQIQSHPREGAALLSPFQFLSEAARLVAHHHERWDGAGYPYGLRAEYIPLSARILAIADVFDTIAIRSASLQTALRALCSSAGSQFDPLLTLTFCDRLADRSRTSCAPGSEAASSRRTRAPLPSLTHHEPH